MISNVEYAAISAHVYNDQRGGGGAIGDVNRLDLPTGWSQLSTSTGFAVGDTLNAINPFSFTGGAYLNQTTGEIVVAYKGTDFLVEFAGRAWNTVGDLLTDVGLASSKALVLGLGQQLNAMAYYLAVKDWAVDNGHDPAKISFTGHSLGGGLAANMAVWFDRPATTFAAAPFEANTNNPIAMGAAVLAITSQAAFSGSVAVLDEINRLRQLFTGELLLQGEFDRRETAVTNIYNEGEFLQYGRALLPTVVGTDTSIDLGDDAQALEHALGLHSMNLHAAFLFEDRLRQLAKDIPELIPTLLDTSLFAADPNTSTQDLVTQLVNDQLRQGFGADSALTRFTTDIDTLKAAGGVSAHADVRKALIAVAMDYHYHADPGESGVLFTVESGAIHFDLNDINSDFLKGLQLLRDAMSSTAIGGDPFETQALVKGSMWHVQQGGGLMSWQANHLADDVAIGGSGNDVLRAGGGSDHLVGGQGDDLLDGGSGADTLLGGTGTDVYQFTGTFGKDTLIDSDGQGSIQIDGHTLGPARGAGRANVWVAQLGTGTGTGGNSFVTLTLLESTASSTGKVLVIAREGNTNTSSSDTITINHFNPQAAAQPGGYLGIQLDPVQRLALVQGSAISAGASTTINTWSDTRFEAARLNGMDTSVAEGGGKSFTVSLSRAALAGETLTLALTGALADQFKVNNIDGGTLVNANGAVITLAPGQTFVSFNLMGNADLSADLAGSLSVSYQDTTGATTSSSNGWGLTLADSSEAGQALTLVGGVRVNAGTYQHWLPAGGYETRRWGAGKDTLIGGGGATNSACWMQAA